MIIQTLSHNTEDGAKIYAKLRTIPPSVVRIVRRFGGIVAASADDIAALVTAAMLLHASGFGLGYLVARIFHFDKIIARTVSIEVGMQNSGMAAALARQHFSVMPLAAAVGVFSGVSQSILGGLLAAWWRRRSTKD